MAKLNLAEIRRQNATALKQYERFGVKLFTKALKEQAKNFDPKIMQDAYLEFYSKVFIDSVKKEYNRIRVREKVFTPSEFFLSTWTAWIRDWVKNDLRLVINIVNENTRQKITDILESSIEQNLNPFLTAKLIAKEVGDIKRARAIARTESTRAMSMGKEQAANQWVNETGQNLYKIWVWGGSHDPRIQHQQAQNKPIPKNDFFKFIDSLGKEVLMLKPGDLSGGASQNINCSCTVVYFSERYARRNYPDAF